MRYILGVPFVNRKDLLARCLKSAAALACRIVVIDNSLDGLSIKGGHIEVLRPPVPLSASQSINMLMTSAVEDDCEMLLYMHSDAIALDGTLSRLIETANELTDAGRRWGAIFTNEDTLAAFNLEIIESVGHWDTTLPQYFADNDYYRRIELGGFDIIQSRLPVQHQEDGSATIRSDPERAVANQFTFPLYRTYYTMKWGGPPGHELYRWEFNGAEYTVRLGNLRSSTLYERLMATSTCEESLMNRCGEFSAAAQLATLRSLLADVSGLVVEVGTGRSMLGLLLSEFCEDVRLETIDVDPDCAAGVEILNGAQRKVRASFHRGPSREILPQLELREASLVFIDGARDMETVAVDLMVCLTRRVRLVVCVGTKRHKGVRSTVESVLSRYPQYRRIFSRFQEFDECGLDILALKE